MHVIRTRFQPSRRNRNWCPNWLDVDLTCSLGSDPTWKHGSSFVLRSLCPCLVCEDPSRSVPPQTLWDRQRIHAGKAGMLFVCSAASLSLFPAFPSRIPLFANFMDSAPHRVCHHMTSPTSSPMPDSHSHPGPGLSAAWCATAQAFLSCVSPAIELEINCQGGRGFFLETFQKRLTSGLSFPVSCASSRAARSFLRVVFSFLQNVSD